MHLQFIKAHAYGNDFLYVRDEDTGAGRGPELARRLCERHAGLGADGLILYRLTATGARMHLFNADGSYSEVSGNGVRGLAAIIARERDMAGSTAVAIGDIVIVETDAGPKRLTLLDKMPGRYSFRAAMGPPSGLRQTELIVEGRPVAVSILSMGNPQCVLLESRLDEARMRHLGALLEHHAAFPDGTNVEFAAIEAPDRIRILIWERGVGPTRASGTGACAAAVAAAAHGGAAREMDVISPGGTQRVDWREDDVYLTGWAEILATGTWLG
jgi:diaminopimelate epimerase